MSFAVWITGPPASGKSTLARAFRRLTEARGLRVVTLESDALREILTPGATYAPEERDRFYTQIVDLAALLVGQGFPVLIDATASRRAYRERARARIARFLEVFVTVPLSVREARDPKGLYRRAREGKAPYLPGAGTPYEEPERPDLVLSGEAPPEIGAGLIFLRVQDWTHVRSPELEEAEA